MENFGIERLRNFVVVAEVRNISSAARRIGRTQSAVSLQIKSLEGMAGAALIRRLPHGVQLTPKGEDLLVHARIILKAHDRAFAAISRPPIIGDVKLGCPDDYVKLLPNVLALFAADYPMVQINLVCAPTPDLEKMLVAGDLDLSIMTRRAATKSQILRREPLVWVGRADMEQVTDSEILLAASHATSLDRLAAIEALDRAARPYKIVCESGSLAGLEAALDGGIAVAVLAKSIVPARFKILAEGWPRLPDVEVVVKHASGSPTAIAQKLEASLRLNLMR
jgi:DNA-binding transcriptional LysR family regulator